jgi:hypothetical protein
LAGGSAEVERGGVGDAQADRLVRLKRADWMDAEEACRTW